MDCIPPLSSSKLVSFYLFLSKILLRKTYVLIYITTIFDNFRYFTLCIFYINNNYNITIDDQLALENDVNGLPTLRLRMNLHDRVAKLADLCFEKKGQNVFGLHPPSRFVLIDPYWLDRFFYSFTVCDDWSHLLKSSKSFRNKKL